MTTATVIGMALLTVRVYGATTAPGSDYQSSLAEAHRIVRRAGITLQWLRCDSGPAGPVTQCAEQLGPDEVILRIADSGRRPAGEVVSMGFSLIDRDQAAPARFSTVWVDRVHSMATRAGADPGRLLGRAIAHELGHLLLNRRPPVFSSSRV